MTKRRRWVGMILLSAGVAQATDYYVDGACANDGNGLANECAASAGGAGARKSGAGLQAVINAASCGDTIYVSKFTGSYTDSLAGGNFYQDAAFTIHSKNCTSGAPFTIRGRDLNNKPKVCSEASCTSAVDRAAFNISSHSNYVRIIGFEIVGGVSISGDGSLQSGLELSYNDISGGSDCDGNYNQTYIDDSEVWVHHNLYHNLGVPCGGIKVAIKTFGPYNSILEFNTVVQGSGPAYGHGFEHKDCTSHLTERFNILPGSTRVNSQDQNCGLAESPPFTNNRFYGNIYTDNPGGGFQFTADMGDPLEFYNNTLIGTEINVYGDSGWGPVRDISVHDNLIVSGGSGQTATNVNVEINNESWPYHSAYDWDFNVYNGAFGYYGGGSSRGDLPSWRSVSGFDANSSERTCSFLSTSPSSPDFYKLAPGDPCKTAGTGGGEVGAYGVTNCVGHTCGDPSDMTPPSAPRNVRVSS